MEHRPSLKSLRLSIDEFYTPATSQHSINSTSRQKSADSPRKPFANGSTAVDEAIDMTTPDDVQSQGPADEESHVRSDQVQPWSTVENIDALGLSLGPDDSISRVSTTTRRFSIDSAEFQPVTTEPAVVRPQSPQLAPFNRWMKNLHSRAAGRRNTVSDTDQISLSRDTVEDAPHSQKRYRHKKSLSSSSLGFITAVKSASISLASFSVGPRSRKTAVSFRQVRAERSGSKTSNFGPRLSEDSMFDPRGALIDEGVRERSLKRRRVLEEIISTEESYLADIRFLMNVYVTLLASIPTICPTLRASIKRNLCEIVELHEELLGELHRVVPHSEYTHTQELLKPPAEPRHHHRWRSLDAVPELAAGSSSFSRTPELLAEPQVAAEVAKAFGKKMYRFFAYEEYGAKYEAMVQDVASTYRTIPQWDTYQKGLETLAAAMASINSQQGDIKKSLTVGDLLVKPIQRICRYPLLFAELLKQTPVCDCPSSHLEIEKVLTRLRETTAEINRATDDPRMKTIMDKTWLLQDRLRFPEKFTIKSSDAIRTLGHIHLCGVLHVTWQTRDGVNGQYMICLLYGDYLLLAASDKTLPVYNIQAGIGLGGITVDDVDSGRGVSLYEVFLKSRLLRVNTRSDHQLYEIIMSACSPKEELEWRSRLRERAGKEQLDPAEQALITTMSLDIKPMGTVFGKPGTVARRLSIHRATTLGPKSHLCQVIIKNTSAIKDAPPSSANPAIIRSQSLLSTNRIPVLAPARVERVKLEALISDVWTRDILPFPGMTGRARSEHLVRSSASSMMRKLSVASIASNFTKRSGSLVSMHKLTDDAKGEEEPRHFRHESVVIENFEASETSLRGLDGGKRVPPISKSLSCSEVQPEDSTTDMLDRGSPISTMRRITTLRGSRSWHQAPRHQRISPPLRTSSANSVNARLCSQVYTQGVKSTSDLQRESLQGVENTRKYKVIRRKRSGAISNVTANKGPKSFSTEGFLSFFR